MPNSGGFERVDISSYSLPVSIKEVHRAINGGFVLMVEFEGWKTGNIVAIGVSDGGKVVGTKIIQSNDSMLHNEEWNPKEYFNGADLGSIDNVDIVAGCTISSTGYRAAVKDALEAASILN